MPRLPAFAILFPIHTVSELNRRGHEPWRETRRRSKDQKNVVRLMLGPKKKFSFPITVKLTRLAPRELDEGDNLNASMKSARDAIAHWLGVNDGDAARVRYEYAQEKSGTYGARMEIYEP